MQAACECVLCLISKSVGSIAESGTSDLCRTHLRIINSVRGNFTYISRITKQFNAILISYDSRSKLRNLTLLRLVKFSYFAVGNSVKTYNKF